MKRVTVSSRSKAINDLLKKAQRENLVIRSPEGREFILAELDRFSREIELTRGNKQLMALLDRRARQTETVPLEEARARLGLR